jgi:glucose/arabinose dehydrogenase
MRTLPVAIGLTLALVGSAFAQSPNNQSQNNQGANRQGQNQQTQNQQGQRTSIRQQVMENLQKSGFTDIHIMPESFLVRAKDKDGNPVMMVMNPDSITAVTEIPSGNRSSTTTGSGSQGGNNPTNSPNNQNK